MLGKSWERKLPSSKNSEEKPCVPLLQEAAFHTGASFEGMAACKGSWEDSPSCVEEGSHMEVGLQGDACTVGRRTHASRS